MFSQSSLCYWQRYDTGLIFTQFIKVKQSPMLLVGYYPTIRKSYNKPDTEPPISYGFAGMRYFFILFAVPDPTWETLMYPAFLMISDWGFAVFIVIRRAQLGFPLHEYHKPEEP